jgi:hypothetical protein
VDLSDAAAASAHDAAAGLSRTDGPPIELALHLPADRAAAALALSRIDLTGVDLVRLLAFTAGHDTTQPVTLDAVRVWLHALGRAATPIATGTASDLARIHLAPAPLVPGDAVCWAMDPQAHATDLTTIAETPDGARDQVRSVRHRHPGVPVTVAASFGRHGQPDPRIGSLFAAGWTLALIAALGEAGADSVTLLDDPGAEEGLASQPLVRVLAALAPYAGARVRPMASPVHTLRALWIEAAAHDVLFVANLAPRPFEVTLPAGHGPWVPMGLGQGVGASVPPPGPDPVEDRIVLGPCAIARLGAPRR